MQTSNLVAEISQNPDGELLLSGEWTASQLTDIERLLFPIRAKMADQVKGDRNVLIDGSALGRLDSIGAWILQREIKKWREQGWHIRLQNWTSQHQKLMAVLEEKSLELPSAITDMRFLERLGRATETAWKDAYALLSFVGESATSFVRLLPHRKRWRWRMMLHEVQIAGVNAVPIVAVTSMMLGVVIAYQGADQLKHYGANIFVVDLVGYSILREFSPLITAIIVAGRSGSAYAAQIGTMVVNEEIDAMRTIGVEPIDLLVLPKVLALVLALPLLTVFSDIAGVAGGMIMARSQLSVSFAEFLLRFGREVEIASLMVGVGKAVVFALVIAMIGCFQGFQAKANADSVGRQTTRSVVQSIFIIIAFDALFSVILNILEL